MKLPKFNRTNGSSSNQLEKFLKRERNEDPNLSRRTILGDSYLRHIYSVLLNIMLDKVCVNESQSQRIVELGSAGGITAVIDERVITSDLRSAIGVQVVADGCYLPFEDSSVDGMIAKDVLHHLPNPISHFREIARVLKPGCSIVYAEPNWNLFSKIIFTRLHPEPYEENQNEWSRKSSDPMDANQALAKIIFVRDRSLFERTFNNLNFEVCPPTYGISYLLSGGVFNRTLIGSQPLKLLDKFETLTRGWLRIFGLNRIIVITKKLNDACV